MLLLLLLVFNIYAYQLQLFQAPLLDNNDIWKYSVNGNNEYFCQDNTCYFPNNWSTYPSDYAIVLSSQDIHAKCTQIVSVPIGLACTDYQITISARSTPNNQINISAIWNDLSLIFDNKLFTTNYTNITVDLPNSTWNSSQIYSGIIIRNNKYPLAINGIFLTANCSDIFTYTTEDSTQYTDSFPADNSSGHPIIITLSVLFGLIVVSLIIYLVCTRFINNKNIPFSPLP
jgi:hypothetical protein